MNKWVGEELYFIGGLFPKERENEIRKNTKSGLQSAANNLQWKFVRGFDACLGPESVRLINSEYIGSFPMRYKQLVIPRLVFRHSDSSAEDISVGFINIPVLKEFSRASGLMKEIKQLPKQNGVQRYFVGYAATYPVVRALNYAKKVYPDSVTCLIVPDLPQYMELGQKGPGLLQRIKNSLVGRKMKMMDCYVPLTKRMAPYLGADSDNFAVVEGIAEEDKDFIACNESSWRSLPSRYVLYTGTMQYQYGIRDLLSAFESINCDDVGLVLCGDGEAVNEIRSLAQRDQRVRYMGVLDKNEVAYLRKNASVLVNPRKNEGEFTKFSFPSKVMEYLSSGVPTVAYKLDGMPDDYNGLFIDATHNGLKRSIELALNMDSREKSELTNAARDHVLTQKNPKAQCEKVLSLLRERMRTDE